MQLDAGALGLRVQAIVTVPPYAPFLEEVAAHPLVCGLRLNTVMPLAEPKAEALSRLAGLGRLKSPLWVDLKGRQLRVVEAAVPPFTEVRVSHRIKVHVPADAFFDDGRQHARIVAVDGDRLILEDGPRRVIGPGESVNVVHPSLRIEGTLTEVDRAWLAAMKEVGQRRVMLSYAERAEDVAEVRELLPAAEVLLKIETQRGLDLARAHRATLGRLVAARGDLFVEVMEPHRLIGAVRTILQADPEAIAASRLFPSLAHNPVPEAPDLGDAAFLMLLGYRTFLLGDDVCLRRDSVIGALNLLGAVADELDDG